MASRKNEIRVGICKETNRKVLQMKDIASDDAIDEKGWLCLHDNTIEEEMENVLKFNYKIIEKIDLN